MFARSVTIRLKPNSVAEFTGRLRKTSCHWYGLGMPYRCST